MSLPAPAQPVCSFAEAFRFWLMLGFISFGGPGGQIAIMHSELVEKKKWVSEARFLHALNYCMLLPGPEATQLAIYIGWLLHRTWGGIVAGVLFVLPSAVMLWGLSFAYVKYGKVPWVEAILFGLKPAVLAIVASALLRLAGKALKSGALVALAGVAFVGIFFFHVPFPVIVLGAGAAGWLGGKLWPEKFSVSTGGNLPARPEEAIARMAREPEHRGFWWRLRGGLLGVGPGNVAAAGRGDNDPAFAHVQPSLARALKIGAVTLALWWVPLLVVGWTCGWKHALFREGVFFSKAALVTFGGAYAVLPYVGQEAVGRYGWLTASQMLDGLGLAETTPGPLIMVLQFVGFLGGWHQPGSLPPLVAATLGSFVTTWATFAPCFLWIFLGAPHIERLRGQVRWTTALSAITAAVVGVILNLAVWFGWQVLFPGAGRMDSFATIVAGVAFVGMMRWNWNVALVVIGAGLAGLVLRLAIL